MATQLKKLPIGIQTFSHIRKDNYLYIDKTDLAEQLINDYKFVFLSRPRRFGKSLFLSTLQALFEGRKELFTDLAIENTYNWEETYPVIRLDMSGKQSNLEETTSSIQNKLNENEQRLGLTNCRHNNIGVYFNNLINQAAKKYNQEVVVLIDEYDKPIQDNITKPDVREQVRELLHGLYVQMKSNDEFIRFAFLTGVSKFSKVSIFSGLNNLQDITLNPKYATVCGYTQHDVETSFAPYLEGVDMHQLKDWYNGYQFNGEPVYNPFDILKFIDSGFLYGNYWFASGTPTFLMQQLQKKQYYLPDFENIIVDENDINISNIDNLGIEALFLQTGYLTIDKIEQQPFGGLLYYLRLPNKEVRTSLASHIIPFITQSTQPTAVNRNTLYSALHSADMEEIKNTLTTIFAGIPYHLYSNSPLAHYEGFYSIVIYSYLLSLGLEIELEKSTNKGRLDMVVDIADKRYLIEFKMNGKGDAIEQIKQKQYFQAFYNSGKKTYLVGIHFDEAERNISQFEWETYTSS